MFFGKDPFNNSGDEDSFWGWLILYIVLLIMFIEFLPYIK
nr:hypothetical protein [uncultured Mediterranean phage uvMED]